MYVFYLENQHMLHPFSITNAYSLDYLKITNENDELFGTYCSQQTGRRVHVTGNYAVITFHSDDIPTNNGGFLMLFSFVPRGKTSQLECVMSASNPPS